MAPVWQRSAFNEVNHWAPDIWEWNAKVYPRMCFKFPVELEISHCILALAGKFKKWSKNLGSVLKRCEYDVRSTKKNLGSIGGSLEEPQPKHVHWCLAQRFAHCMSFAKAICGPKKFHPVCLTFDPLGLQMTTIAQNDQNLLRI